MNQQLLDYLRENRSRYTRDALRRTLVDAGYVPAEIDKAFAALEAEEAGGPAAGTGVAAAASAETAAPEASGWGETTTPRREKEAVSTSPRFWLVFIGFVLAVYGLGGFLVAALGQSGALAGILVLAALIGGAVGWAMKREEDRPLAMGLGCGVLFSIGVPFIGVGVLFGLCVAGGGRLVG